MHTPSSCGPTASPEDRFPTSVLKALAILAHIRSRPMTDIRQDDIDALHRIFADGRMPEPTDALNFRIPTNRAPADAVTLWNGYRPGDPIPPRARLVQLAVPPGTWPHAIEALRREYLAERGAVAIATAALTVLDPEQLREAITNGKPWHEAARTAIVGLGMTGGRMDKVAWHRRRAAIIDAVGHHVANDPLGWVERTERRSSVALRKAPSGEWPRVDATPHGRKDAP